MTIAELHGKISRFGSNLHDQMEDLLTSDVFSVCKYIRPESLFLPFLRTAISIDNCSLASLLPENVISASYRFWPSLKHSEPDLAILLQFNNSSHILLLIEAKYLSPKSGFALEEDALVLAKTPSDQLAREYIDLLDAHTLFDIDPVQVVSRILIYITAGKTLPKNDLFESIRELKQIRPGISTPRLFWTTWFNLYPIIKKAIWLEPWEKPILDDLRQLLERKMLVSFHGFTIPLPVVDVQPFSPYQTMLHSGIKRNKQYQFEVREVNSIVAHWSYHISDMKYQVYNWVLRQVLPTNYIYKRTEE